MSSEDLDSDIHRLRRQSTRLKFACTGLGLIAFLLFQSANTHRINVYEDWSLQYSPGMFVKNQQFLSCYYSSAMESYVIGYLDRERNQWSDIGWLMYGPDEVQSGERLE